MPVEFRVPPVKDETDPPNHGTLWTFTAITNLKRMFLDKAGLLTLCREFGRTQVSILKKLEALSLIYPANGRYYLSNDSEIAIFGSHPEPTGKGYDEPNLASKTPICNKQPIKENDMPTIETKVFISGQLATEMTDMQIFSKIAKLEDGIEVLKRVKARPIKLTAMINEMQQDVLKLVEYVDNRTDGPKASANTSFTVGFGSESGQR